MTNEPESLSSGTAIAGYTVGDAIFVRSGACTYNATDAEGRELWFTVYSPTCFPSALVRERSLRELRQLMTVQSKQVLTVLDVGKMEDGGIYEVTERIAGTSLSHKNGALDRKRVASLLSDIGQALLAAQKVGVIHRNLGPEAVFDTGDGVKVASFAVAEPQGTNSFGPLSTIAPEQVAGKVVDQRSMVYNLAALGHRLLTGGDLYTGNQKEVLAAHLEQEVPEGVEPVLAKGLAKDPQRRPMMLKQFVQELVALSPELAKDSDAAEAEDPQKAEKKASSASSSTSKGGKPSTRGWTQFMDEEDMGDGESSASSSSSSLSASASQSGTKPTTRGWTLFMEGDAVEPEPEAAKEEPPEEEKVELGAGQSSSSGKKPSTRGWTMFMDAPEGATDEEKASAKDSKDNEVNTEVRPLPKLGEQDPEPSAAAKSQTRPVASAAASSSQNKMSKPKTRGWTMFMDADGAEDAPKESAKKANAARAKPSPSPASSSDPMRPAKTRGWTMFMDQPAASPSPSGGGKDAANKQPAAKPGSASPQASSAAHSSVSSSAPRMAAKPPTPLVEPGSSQRKSGQTSKTPPRTLDLSGVSGIHPRPKVRERKTDELAALSSRPRTTPPAAANSGSRAGNSPAESSPTPAANQAADAQKNQPTPAPLPTPPPQVAGSDYEGYSLTQIIVVAALVGVVLAGLVLMVARSLTSG